MSFRKLNSFSKHDKKTEALETPARPFELLVKLFTRTSNASGHKRHESSSFSHKSSTNSKLQSVKEFDFLWNLEFVLIYTANLIRQKIDKFNQVNLIQQFLQCSRFLETHLKESQSFVDNLKSYSNIVQIIKETLEHFKDTHLGFSQWIESVSEHNDKFDPNIAQDLFFNMEVKAKIFIDKLKLYFRESDKEYKRSSIDNSSLISFEFKSLDSNSTRRSRFNDDDRKLLDKIKKLGEDIDLPPPKPAIPTLDEDSLNSYLNQVEEKIKLQKESEYDYPSICKDNEFKSLKIENNCIMASSIISNDIPPVDMDSIEDFTPIPDLHNSFTNEFNFSNNEVLSFPNIISDNRSKDHPLPPVPGTKKTSRIKLTQQTPNFPSEEIHYRKISMIENGQSRVTNGQITNFNHRSLLRSPTLISSINLQNNRSPETKLPIVSTGCHNSNVVQSPTSYSSNIVEGTSVHSFNTSRQLLMAKQIPSIVDDPNDLLNINDMKDDIDIITRSFGPFNVDCKNTNRISDLSTQTNFSTQSEPQPGDSKSLVGTLNNDTYCNSEVKSDTEEYFEYFEIDGKKYRRKMKKRIVIEKIKIRKTILAPMKADGSGPDFSNLKDEEKSPVFLENNIDVDQTDNSIVNNEKSIEIPQPRFRRGNEDRFRVSKSMFYPYRDEMKRLTLCPLPVSKSDSNNKLFPLMNKYMYRFGESEFEEPVIDKRFSTQLADAVYSTWIKTSESILPHEKSKSICYLKKSRQKNDDGATVHNAVHVTASRTIRMKMPDTVNQQLAIEQPSNKMLSVLSNTEEDESIIDGEDSDTSLCITDTSICGADTGRGGQFDSCLLSSDEGKDEVENDEQSLKSDSLSSEQEIKQSNRSTLEDPDLHDFNFTDSSENISVPSQRSSDSCFYSRSSNVSDCKDQFSFILKENNPTQYLIFDEDSKYGECDIAGGPVDALIVYACDGKEHLLFLGAFLDTYRTFIEPEELIYRLIVRYKYFRLTITSNATNQMSADDQTENTDDNPEKKCKHVLSLLLTVIGKLKRDLTSHLNEQIEQFQNYLSEIGEKVWVEAISRAIKTQKQCLEKDEKIVQRVQQLSQGPQIQSDSKSPLGSPTKLLTGFITNKITILSFSSRDIAEQMTLLDWCKYRDVELMEILNLKDIVNCNLLGVIEYAKNFENVQFWTQSILLDPDRMSDRDRMCIKFLRIMKHLQRLNNFSSFIAILLAIQLLPTKKLFSKRVRSKIKEYDNYMKPPRFSGYKEDLKQAVSPCIPFLGIFYQDIVMLNIANPPYLDLEEVIKNTDKSNFSCNNNQLLLSNTTNCGQIINFWRSFKQYIFLKNCNKDQDKIRYSIQPNEKILKFLSNFKDYFDEVIIQRLIKQLA